MRTPTLLLASLSAALCSAAIAAPPAVGETVFEAGFLSVSRTARAQSGSTTCA
jgi:hypothetical protein